MKFNLISLPARADADILNSMEDLRYPIGTFHYDGPSTPADRARFIAEIERLPIELRAAIDGLNQQQLDTPYRPGGWTPRQIVHHLPDSHLNSYTRFKLALTEDEPTIRPYDEARWAELEDGRAGPVDVSLDLLASLHKRWVLVLGAMREQDWSRRLHHPASGVLSLDAMLANYAWHGRHHVAQITSLRRRMGWRE